MHRRKCVCDKWRQEEREAMVNNDPVRETEGEENQAN